MDNGKRLPANAIKYLEYRNKGFSQTTAMKKAGIASATTIHEWRKKFPQFKEREEEAMDATLDVVEDKLMQLIANGEPAAIFFFLKTKGKRRGWSEKADINEKGEYIPPVINIGIVKPKQEEDNGGEGEKD